MGQKCSYFAVENAVPGVPKRLLLEEKPWALPRRMNPVGAIHESPGQFGRIGDRLGDRKGRPYAKRCPDEFEKWKRAERMAFRSCSLSKNLRSCPPHL